jgi:hypothetical protein
MTTAALDRPSTPHPFPYYAFVGPFRSPPRTGAFSYTERTGIGGVLVGLGLLLMFEGVSVHFIIRSCGPVALWLHAAADLYALVWLFAAFQAARLRPVLVTADQLLVRTSLLWTASVPRATVASVARIGQGGPGTARTEPGVLRATFGAAPELLVTLRAPVLARGPFGITKSVTAIALYVDEPAALQSALAEGTTAEEAVRPGQAVPADERRPGASLRAT